MVDCRLGRGSGPWGPFVSLGSRHVVSSCKAFPRCGAEGQAVGSQSRATVVEAVEPRLLFAVPAGFEETRVATGMPQPMAMAFAPDGRLFVGQKDGTIRVVKDGQLLSTPFASLEHDPDQRRARAVRAGVRPELRDQQFVYVAYTSPPTPYPHQVIRLTANGDVATGGRTTILELDPPTTPPSHNGGALAFGGDGKLYVAVGDSQQSAKAAQKNNFYGKMLRINKDGSIPTDNPFYNTTTGKNRAVWAYGLRNPFSFAVQPGTGRMFINDVGETSRSRRSTRAAGGANYGWPGSEGPTTNPDLRRPVLRLRRRATSTPRSPAARSTTRRARRSRRRTSATTSSATTRARSSTSSTPRRSTATDFVTGADLVIDIDVAPDGALYYLSREGDGAIYRVRATRRRRTAPTITVQPADQTVAAGQPATFTVEAAGAGAVVPVAAQRREHQRRDRRRAYTVSAAARRRRRHVPRRRLQHGRQRHEPARRR